jgi:micrococcal nuclease
VNYRPSRFIRRFIVATIACFLLATCSLCSNKALAEQSFSEARIIAVNDGDTVTLIMSGKKYRTRLIGIDAPEMGQYPWGRRAKEHLRNIIKQHGWSVFVETDIVQYDKYGRLLAYLWTKEKDCINERMLLEGYAVLFTIQPNSRHVERFKRAQRIARQEKRGIWGPEGLTERPLDYKKKHPRL